MLWTEKVWAICLHTQHKVMKKCSPQLIMGHLASASALEKHDHKEHSNETHDNGLILCLIRRVLHTRPHHLAKVPVDHRCDREHFTASARKGTFLQIVAAR